MFYFSIRLNIPTIFKLSKVKLVIRLFFFFKHNFCVKPYVPREPEATQVIVGSMNMGYISDTARNRTHNSGTLLVQRYWEVGLTNEAHKSGSVQVVL